MLFTRFRGSMLPRVRCPRFWVDGSFRPSFRPGRAYRCGSRNHQGCSTAGRMRCPASTQSYRIGVLHGPGRWTVDMSLGKTFVPRESVKLTLRVDFFNALNHVNYNSPDLSVTSP